MTKDEALKFINDSVANGDLQEDDKFIVTEALDYMIRETGEQKYMVYLGEIYLADEHYELARKYFEMASAKKSMSADEYLGMMWSEGLTGEIDYEKAYQYYDSAMIMGSFVGLYKLADMYRYGLYVEEDYDMFCEMIEGAHNFLKDTEWLDRPLPEINLRLAEIRLRDDDMDSAFELLMDAKDFLAERMIHDMYPDDIDKMEEVIGELYQLIDIDDMDLSVFELYDMFEILSVPCRFGFTFNGKRHWVESVYEDHEIVVNFEGKWYRSIKGLIKDARIDGVRLTTVPYDLSDGEISVVDLN